MHPVLAAPLEFHGILDAIQTAPQLSRTSERSVGIASNRARI
jgi:hypothetical protein